MTVFFEIDVIANNVISIHIEDGYIPGEHGACSKVCSGSSARFDVIRLELDETSNWHKKMGCGFSNCFTFMSAGGCFTGLSFAWKVMGHTH